MHFLLQEAVSPNVLAMIKAFNQLALLVPTEILAEDTPKSRAKVIEAFIKVSKITSILKLYN